MRYSAWELLTEGLTGNRGWKPMWRDPDPKPEYDVVIVGGGGHGLATAHYLAREFGITNVAVLEKGWLGSGNIGWNTTIVRSNYLLAGNQPFYDLSMRLWEGLEQDLNYNVMFSQRGILNLFHSDTQRDAFVRRGNAMRLAGTDAELLDRDALARMCPFLDFDNARFPIRGALWQPRAGTARHDAVAWGFARAADARGVDIVQNCEVTGFMLENGRCRGVETTRGPIRAARVAVCVAGSSGRVMALAGLRLPVAHEVCASGMAIMPMIGRARVLRMWGGVMDMPMDGSPFIDRTDIEGLLFNGGWCYGGFKATPASGFRYAHLIATGRPHPVAAAFRLDRFTRGAPIDESGAGAQPNLH